MEFEKIKAQADQYMMHTYHRFSAALVKGKNATAWDADGKKYIDFTAGIGVNSIGYADPKWVAAVSKQAGEIQHTCNLFYNPQVTSLAENLCKTAGFSKVFFGNSGAEANECAVKVARKYSSDRYGFDRCEVITLRNSFHGRTLATLAATGQEHFHELFTPLPTGFITVEPDLQSVMEKLSDKTCAIFYEPIQGEGGVLPLTAEFVKALRKLCDEKDIILVADEVQTGVGRSGTFYATEQFGVKPDVLTSAKGLGGGLPIGACLVGEKCAEVLGVGDHGTTFGGNPVVCAGANVVLERLNTPGFLQEVSKKGAFLQKSLSEMKNIENVRGMGLMVGAKPVGKTAAQIADQCVENGLLVLTAKDVLRFLPPLTITIEELKTGLSILEKVLA